MRVLVSGGGTGGHVYPALSIIEALVEYDPSVEVTYVGTEKGIESRIVRDQGIPFETLNVEGLNRKFSLDTFRRLFKLGGAMVKAKMLLSKYKPAFVLGTGGYVSFPILFMASLKGIPVFIHEQNAYPGVANKALSKRAEKIFISFPDSIDHFNVPKDKLVLSGNPVRREFSHLDRQGCREILGISENVKVILAFGGSGGAAKINELVLELAKTLGKRSDIKIIHATGKRYYEDLSARDDLPDNIDLRAYIDDMPVVMGASDVIIGRSGAITLAEISTLGKPSVLMPSPNVANDHQMKNARAFEKADAAMIVKENEGDMAKTVLRIIRMVDDDKQLVKMGKNANKVMLQGASSIIADEIMKRIG